MATNNDIIEHTREEIKQIRAPQHNVHELLLSRWSPRFYSGEKITQKEWETIVTAGMTAPSSANNQPQRVFYAFRETPQWQPLFDLLMEGNQAWVKNAALLALIVSKGLTPSGKPYITHSFDTGSFFYGMLLQGASMRIYGHGMAGFDYEGAKKQYQIPDNYRVEAMVCFGRLGKKEPELSDQLEERERQISARRPLQDIAFTDPNVFTTKLT